MRLTFKRFEKTFRKKAFWHFAGAAVLVLAGLFIFWISTFTVPDLHFFESNKIAESTKIYDRTGEVLLYDVFANTRRTIIPYEEISRNVKNATVAIEDNEFYQHRGIKFTSIARAILANILGGGFSQGGSTITQQVVKNSILTTDKTISRKLKEWVLAWKLEQQLNKDQILALYLNGAPYGGSIYGVEEASKTYFGISSQNLSLAQAAYLAAMPQAPSYYSPYGSHRKDLDSRKNLVLAKMLENKFISQTDFDSASQEKVTFALQSDTGIKAPHFSLYVKQQLEELLGKRALEQNGYKVITTLDYGMEAKAEEIVKRHALQNKTTFNAENAALVAIDPKTGEVLAMVGSRDYFDKEIDGNFNVTLAHRQPGSAFKPFVYATAFMKGYTPATTVFDLQTEFQTTCNPDGTPIIAEHESECYMPENYDGKFRGPVSLRTALIESLNIPSIKVLYLAGIRDSLKVAKDMGISSLGNADQYGLTLVLGGGEVSLLELTSGYSVFANDGVRNAPISILRVEDPNGQVVYEPKRSPFQTIPQDIAREISDILSDNTAKTRPYIDFSGQAVAAKTGTTNDYRDAWVIGYTPNLAVGAWAGNNNNSPMEKKVAGFIITPLWREFMQAVLPQLPDEQFTKPNPIDSNLKPPLRGFWQGTQNYFVDKLSGKLATEYTPAELREEKVVPDVHSLLYWVDRNSPLGSAPADPTTDPQFNLWEVPVRKWVADQQIKEKDLSIIPTQLDDIHKPEYAPQISVLSPQNGAVLRADTRVTISISAKSRFNLTKADYFINGSFAGSATRTPFSFSFVPNEIDSVSDFNTLRVVVYDAVLNRGEVSSNFLIQK
ncbi:MAG: penicillin-binding protein [Candidatus Paceibacterota bacterium]